MPLAGYQPQTREIQLGGDNSFVVQGLSLNKIAVLIREHFPDLDTLVVLFQGFETMSADQFQPLALSLVSQAPGFVANVIALAAGEGDASDAEKLPGPVQVKALVTIGELTFSEVGGVGKSLETIAGLLKTTKVMDKFQKTPMRRKTNSFAATSDFAAM